jgi:hypothetical protein
MTADRLASDRWRLRDVRSVRGTGIIESWSETVEAKSSPNPLATLIRRRPILALVAFGAVSLGIVAFPWSLMAIQAFPESLRVPAALSVTPTQTKPEDRAHPLPVALHPASPVPGGPMPDSTAAYRHGGAGLAENFWDFNAPDGVPGYGPLDAAEVRRLAKMLLEQ